MIDKNPQAMSLAFKKVKSKLQKIKELNITPDMSAESIETLIETLATAKAVADGTTLAENVKGQRWYVTGLVEFSGYDSEKKLDHEYQDAFADSASEDEMVDAIRKMELAA